MSTTFDLASAKSTATESDTKALHLAAGRLSNVFDDMITSLVESSEGTPTSKIMILEQQAERFGNGGLAALVNGSHSNPRALGAGSPTGDDDLQDQLDKANAQNETLKKDRKSLEKIVLELGLNAPASTNTPFPDDIAQRVKAKVEEKEEAARTAATPTDVVAKTVVAPLIAAIEDAADDLSTGMMTSKIDGLDELDAAVEAAKGAVS